MATFAIVVGVGVAVMAALFWLLGVVDAPSWIAIGLWIVPTLAALSWVLVRPRPAVATDDDDDAWTTFAIQYALVGFEDPRPAPLRVIAAALFGAPVVWSLLVFGLSTLAGLFDL